MCRQKLPIPTVKLSAARTMATRPAVLRLKGRAGGTAVPGWETKAPWGGREWWWCGWWCSCCCNIAPGDAATGARPAAPGVADRCRCGPFSGAAAPEKAGGGIGSGSDAGAATRRCCNCCAAASTAPLLPPWPACTGARPRLRLRLRARPIYLENRSGEPTANRAQIVRSRPPQRSSTTPTEGVKEHRQTQCRHGENGKRNTQLTNTPVWSTRP